MSSKKRQMTQLQNEHAAVVLFLCCSLYVLTKNAQFWTTGIQQQLSGLRRLSAVIRLTRMLLAYQCKLTETAESHVNMRIAAKPPSFRSIMLILLGRSRSKNTVIFFAMGASSSFVCVCKTLRLWLQFVLFRIVTLPMSEDYKKFSTVLISSTKVDQCKLV